MAFQSCPGIVQLEAVYVVNSEVVENVYHVHATGSIDTTLCNSLISALIAWDAASFVGVRSVTSFLIRVIATDLTSQSGARVARAVSPQVAGTNGGAPLPNNATCAIKWNTGLRGRSNRGRTYIIGMTDNMLQASGQYITTALQAAFITCFQALVTDLNAVSTCTMVVLSRRNGGAARANGIGIPILTAEFVDLAVDSQRRRLPLHNRHR